MDIDHFGVHMTGITYVDTTLVMKDLCLEI